MDDGLQTLSVPPPLGRAPSRTDAARAALDERGGLSREMAVDRRNVIAGPPAAAGAPGLDLILQSGTGAHVVDIDGNRLLDLCMGFGAQLLGHGHPAIAAALTAEIAAGWPLGAPQPAQLDLARLIQDAAPANERVALCATGSDASLLAMRAARAFTGKDVIGVFAGSFHGMHDYGLVSAEATSGPGLGSGRKMHVGAGIPRIVDQTVSALPYGHPAAFDLIRRQRHELAAVVVEPVRPGEPHLDAGPWLEELARACRQSGVLLVLDETTTGFRLAYGGAQELFGLSTDLTIYGKAVGGGLPLGAVAGRADVMRVFTADPAVPGIFAASTFTGNPLSIAAGHSLLRHLHEQRATLYPALERRSAQLASQFGAIADALQVAARIDRAGSIFRIAFGTREPRAAVAEAVRRSEDLYARLALHRGVLMQVGLRGYVSAAHSEANIEAAVAALGGALGDLKADGLLDRTG